MSAEVVLTAPSPYLVATTTGEANPACCPVVPPSVDQVRASDGVFSQDTRDAQAIAGIIGLYTSALLLHDLAVEHFDTSGDEDDEEGPRLADQPV